MSDRYHRTSHPLAIMAARYFEDGEEAALWKAARDAKAEAERARVAYELAQGRLAKAEKAAREARHWHAVRLLDALDLPRPDPMGSEEAWAYSDCGEVVIGIRKKGS